ncbi:MAG TPA: uroporphyrinogen decarboxylase family protein [Anaerolineae bacterium]|nr:uroporphyrinogen decarboxylase family protein [Anaerolineae bacterium]
MIKPKETIFEAFDLKQTGRVPATVFGGGVWTIRHWQKQFGEMIADPRAYADMIIQTNEELRSPIVYVGSGYNNYLAAAVGGKVKERPLGAPDLDAPLVKESADEIVNTDVTVIENDPIIQNIRQAARLVAQAIGDEVVVTVTAWGPFTLAGQMYGVEPFMKATLKKKDEVHKMLDFATRLVRQFYQPLVEERVIPMISIADPTGSGDLISDRVFRTFSLPYLQPLIGWAKEHGVYTWLHICGNTTDKLESIAETGASCFSLDYKVNLAEARQKIGGRIALAGNIDPVSILNQKGPDDVRAAARACIEAAAAGGGFVLTSGCDLPPTISMENLQAMLSAGVV